MSRMFSVLFAITTLAGTAFAQAQSAESDDLGRRGGLLVQTDFDFGGDNLATVYFDDDEDQDVKAGQGMALSVGGYFRPIETSPFELQMSVGYKFVTTRASNADIGVTRTLLQLEGLYRWPSGFYLGAGLMHHIGPELDGDGFFEDVGFDDATGVNTEIGWRWIGLHYTQMEYSNALVEDVDASHVGVRFTYRFGQRWF